MVKIFARIVMTCIITIALFPTIISAADRPQTVTPQRQLRSQQPPPEVLNKLRADRDALIAKYNADLKQQIAGRNKNLAIELKNTIASKKPGLQGIDPAMPVISAIVPATGIAPGQAFKVLGNNLSAPSAPTVVTVQFAGIAPSLTDQGANSSSQLNYIMGRFEGIAMPTQATVTVKVGSNVSAPFTCTVLPEMVVQSMDLSKIQDHLISDSKSTSPLVNDPLGKGVHKFYMVDNYWFAALHDTWDLHTINKPADLTGNDDSFLTLKLLNNWKVKQIVYRDYAKKNTNVAGCTAGAVSSSTLKTVLAPNNPTNALNTSVSWWNQLCTMYEAYFIVGYIIEGPKGMPYH
jgi:hypothetical protein